MGKKQSTNLHLPFPSRGSSVAILLLMILVPFRAGPKGRHLGEVVVHCGGIGFCRERFPPIFFVLEKLGYLSMIFAHIGDVNIYVLASSRFIF